MFLWSNENYPLPALSLSLFVQQTEYRDLSLVNWTYSDRIDSAGNKN